MTPSRRLPCLNEDEKPDATELKVIISRLHADGLITWAEYESLWERLEK